MSPQLCFFLSIAFSFIAWATVTARYIWRNSAAGNGPKLCGLYLSCTASALSG